jgi:NAD+ kinase
LVRNLRYYYHKAINIVSINTGNIGFYAHFHRDDFKRFMEDIMNSENYSNPYLLEIYVNDKHLNAINEMTIQSLNTISIDITINDIFYETCKGTGVMICTRTGSTG